MYLAEDLRLEAKWAVKRIPCREVRGFQEGNILKSLDHPAFPRIVDCLEEADGIYLVMDYIQGISLEECLKKGGSFESRQIWKWAMELCGALSYLHQKEPPVLYRDLKPSNLILTRENHLRLVDFGIAEPEAENPSLAGSRPYGAPEQFQPGRIQDARTDIYALGVLLYRLASGGFPEGKNKRRRPGNLSGKFSSILWKCMEVKPEERFSSCEELKKALKQCREGKKKGGQSPAMGRRLLLTAAAVLLAVSAGIKEAGTAEREYSRLLEEAKGPGPARDRAEACMQALRLRKYSWADYELLLNIFREDGSFTPEEEEMLLGTLGLLPETADNQEKFRQLAYQIGRLYWYYYSYGQEEGEDNELTRMGAAVPWFRIASEGQGTWKDSARIYARVGSFYQELILLIREGREQGSLRQLWGQIQDLEIQSRQEQGLERLELVRLCFRAAVTWEGALQKEGVSGQEQEELLEGLWNSIGDYMPESIREQKLMEEIRRYRERTER